MKNTILIRARSFSAISHLRGLLFLCIAISVLDPMASAAQPDDNRPQGCRTLDPEIFPPETCSVILTYLSAGDELGPVGEDGEFIVFRHRSGASGDAETLYLPPDLRSVIALNSVRETLKELSYSAGNKSDDVFAAMLPPGRELWTTLRDAYCHYHSEKAYIDLSGTTQSCPKASPPLDEGALNDAFDSAMTFHTNFLVFLNAKTAERLDSERQADQPVHAVVGYPAASPIRPSEPTGGSGSKCAQNISFAVAGNERIVPEVPGFAEKWIRKHQKNYPGICFSQTPLVQAENYLLAFANSTSAFNGIYPTVRTSTNNSVSPVSGSGTVTDNYGGIWDYTYNGTVTTTTTTTENVDLPYTDTSNTLYVYSYDQSGSLLSRHWRTVTARSGGDPYNTLGYNLGSALASIHIRENLLKDAVNDIVKSRR